MKCKVSVIIPIYNSSKYLKELLETLYSQTLQEIEFIFVDDCSNDNSIEILEEIEISEPEKTIIIKLNENMGPGGARNIGLQYARGEYIGFVDSDDLINKEMFEQMYKKASKGNYDLVECGYFNERKNRDMMIWNNEIEGDISLEKRMKMILSCGFIWSKIYKREFLCDSKISFIEKIPFEDVDFLNRIYCRINRVGIINKSLYIYRDNLQSFSRKRNNQSFFEINNVFSKKYLDNMQKEKYYNVLKPVIDYVVIDIWVDVFKSYIKGAETVELDKIEIFDKQLKQYIKDYNENMFIVEKSKKDRIIEAFLVNAYNSYKALEIINNIIN